jgi:hypothetical protein
MTVARVLAKYKLDFVSVQEVRWDKEGTVRAGEYTLQVICKFEKISDIPI